MKSQTEQNLVILNVEEEAIQDKKESFWMYLKSFIRGQGSITLRQKVVFFRIMATMVNASLTPVNSLLTLRKQEKNTNMIRFYDFMLEKTQSGYGVNEALRAYYGNFSDAECSIIEAGEKTGKLNLGLLQIADQTEKIDSIVRKIKGAMTYPLVLIGGMIGVVIILIVKVIPSLMVFFGDPETLPESTKLILAISDFFQNYWILIILSIILLVGGVFLWKKTKNGKYLFDKIILKFPIFGPILQKVILSKFSRVFSNLISNDVAMIESIRIVSSAVGNEVYRQRILLLRQDVRNGMKVAESLEDDPLFPELLVAMLRVGEETAQIGQTIIKIADFYDEEVDIAVGSIQKLIEPVILVAMGVVIGFIAIGVFQPLMGLAGSIGQ